MNPCTNPYACGVGTLPPQLSGRDEIIEQVEIQLDRCRSGIPFRSFLMIGLRGVGKTVLLNHLSMKAEENGFAVVSIETPEKRSLPAIIIPTLRSMILKLNRDTTGLGEMSKLAMKALGGFVNAMKLKYHDIEFGLDLGNTPGVADSGDLESDLVDLFVQLGHAAKEKKTALVLFIDEIQYIEEAEFAALIMALHKCTQKQLPVALIGAGLPQLVGQAGRAKSYAERLFRYPEIGALSNEAAKMALMIPAQKNKIDFESEAIEEILSQKEVPSVAPVRANLINKGTIFSPEHGDICLTVPLLE